jgi:RNA polymerase sigma-70 factor (ECF subfamily)
VADVELEFLEQLYRDYGQPLYAFAFSYTRDRDRAAEVVQDVMYRAWSHVAQLRQDGNSPKSWLFKVTRNLCTDMHRAQLARPEIPVEDDTIAASPAAVQDDVFDRMVEAWNIEEALVQLSPAHRLVIQEIYYEGRTIPEIAQRLGIPPGTVKSRAFNAIRQLKTILNQIGLEP